MEVKRKIIFLNGAPNVGKDTIADYLVKKHSFKHTSFKETAFYDVAKYFEIDESVYMKLYNNRDTKEVNQEILHNLSPREALQYVIEKQNKVKYGKDYLAKLTINNIINSNTDYVVSDFGLQEEEDVIRCLLKQYNYKIIYIERENCNFDNDVRSKRNNIDYHIKNDTLENVFSEIDKIIDRWR